MMAPARPTKITFAEMREQARRSRHLDLLQRPYLQSLAGDQRRPLADDVRLSDIEPRFTCRACGKRSADVRPDFNWNNMPVRQMGYRWQRAWSRRARSMSYRSCSPEWVGWKDRSFGGPE
jgi:hypothetical protein